MNDNRIFPGHEGRLPAAFTTPGSSSFTEFLEAHSAGKLPGGMRPTGTDPTSGESAPAPHATTIVALAFAGGVLMAGDRRATMGNIIAHREMEKVFPADAYSCVGIAGTAGIAIEMVRLFQVELEHYEKIEGSLMSLDGKANRLSAMVRGNLGMAMQGLAAIPLFAGYDIDRGVGRIFSYDVTGGRYEERNLHSIGSGSQFAKGTLKRGWRADLSADDAVSVALDALIEASEEDSATGGPDQLRQIYPVVAVVDADGYRQITQDSLGAHVAALVDDRHSATGAAVQRPEVKP